LLARVIVFSHPLRRFRPRDPINKET
jgi:hypothetical protein